MWQHSSQSNQHGSGQFKNDISKSWSGLNVQLVNRYLPNIDATSKGLIYQVRENMWSTNPIDEEDP